MALQNRPVETLLLPCDEAGLAEAARLVLAGEPVAVPTETVYGLAADATNEAAVARIYEAKGRPSFNPLIVHVADLAQAESTGRFDAAARALAQRWWPGPLTLVVPLRPDAGIAKAVTAGLGTVALRCPAHPAMQALLRACGRPLAAPSANASGTISPTSAGHVLKTLGGRIALVLDGGETARGLESTIVKVDEDGLRLLRPGPVSFAELQDSPPWQGGAGGGSAEGGPNAEPGARAALATHPQPLPSREGSVEAPGQLASHYAPSKPLRLEAAAPDPDEWYIGFGPMAADDSLSERGNLDEAAARLFAALHRADASPKPRIAVAAVPAHGIGLAINDRLRRAAAPREERSCR
jgi:L-threonylcarbamoyladenylate synthase